MDRHPEPKGPVSLEELGCEAAARAAPLMGVGVQSGAVVIGLSGVRRAHGLALVFVAASVSANTQAQLARLARGGCRILRCSTLAPLTTPLGRSDVSVLGVKKGALAEGVCRRLEGP